MNLDAKVIEADVDGAGWRSGRTHFAVSDDANASLSLSPRLLGTDVAVRTWGRKIYL